MNDSKWTWRFVCLISIAATLIFIVGFGYAVKDIVYPQGDAPLTALPQKTGAPDEEVTGILKVVAIGDSLAKGTGDNTGSGFVKRAVEGMSEGDQEVNLLGNLGINGLTTLGLQNELNEEGVKYTLRQANTILVSIGGNDLFRGAGIVQSNSNTSSPTSDEPSAPTDELTSKELLAALPEASKRLEEALLKIAEINPEAKIYFLGLYNPFGDIPELRVPGNQAVTVWNNAAMDIINTHSNMTLVPTFDLFHNHLEKYLSTDHFHPNGDGYQRIADRIIQAVH
ncbi:GDSL-type esterase/lipase family protein [Paenibacillus wynnii]|uniref:GDSL-type esterase/lipase family protein n=1 Tax=Paenibacillus wynnii TaxID=268407 RepID=UPI0027940D07|nr:GDSL-type esterase/lipase family protein [Paenibacillus wynnii]MDQ0192909.1 lysophospholipase L1-like esterase [Paenibacillus wynnii]